MLVLVFVVPCFWCFSTKPPYITVRAVRKGESRREPHDAERLIHVVPELRPEVEAERSQQDSSAVEDEFG